MVRHRMHSISTNNAQAGASFGDRFRTGVVDFGQLRGPDQPFSACK